MNIIQNKRHYNTPLAEAITLSRPHNLLVTLSSEASLEDWELGEDL